MICTGEGTATWSFQIRGGGHPKSAAIDKKDVQVDDMDYMDPPNILFHGCLVQVKYDDWWTGRYYHDPVDEGNLVRLKEDIKNNDELLKLRKERNGYKESKKERKEPKFKALYNSLEHQTNDKMDLLKKKLSEEYENIKEGHYVIEDTHHPKGTPQRFNFKPYGDNKDEWRFPICKIPKEEDTIAVKQLNGGWKEFIVTQIGRHSDNDDTPIRFILYEDDDQVSSELDTWSQQYRIVLTGRDTTGPDYMKTLSDKEDEEMDIYSHHIEELVTYGGIDWTVREIIVNNDGSHYYVIIHDNDQKVVTDHDLEAEEWEPRFKQGERVLFNGSAKVTIDSVLNEKREYTIRYPNESTVDVTDKFLTELAHPYEEGRLVVYNFKLCRISKDNKDGSYNLFSPTEEFHHITDEELDDWCAIWENNRSFLTMCQKKGTTTSHLKLLDSNNKKRQFKLGSHNIVEQVDIHDTYTPNILDEGDEVIEFEIDQSVEVFATTDSGVVGVKGTILERAGVSGQRGIVLNKPMDGWYTIMTADGGVHDYPFDLIGPVAAEAEGKNGEYQEESDDDDIQMSDTDDEEDNEDSVPEQEPSMFEEGDRVRVRATSEQYIVESAVDFEHVYLIDDPKSYKDKELIDEEYTSDYNESESENDGVIKSDSDGSSGSESDDEL
jgi:hypothetical protein